MDDLISRHDAIDELWKALYEYEDKTEKQFQESDELDVGDWMQHRIFVQNMSDIDRQTILALPSADRKNGVWIEENTRPWSGQFYCSVCHRTAYDPQPTRAKGWVKRCRYAFCPNCGAKMEEE